MNNTGLTRPTAVEHLLQAIRELQNRRTLLPPLTTPTAPTLAPDRQVIVVGVSGGKDSICLLHLLCKLTDDLEIEIHVAHCNHNLRPTSPRDRRFVEQIAQTWNLPFHVTDLDPRNLKDSPDGLESAARRARYQFLAATADAVTPAGQQPIIAVAHQRNDQAETVLMNLIRGAGLHGLSGMHYITYYHFPPLTRKIRIIRPLLDTSGSQILAYLSAIGQTWQEDETNQDQSRFRNRVRHQILPLLRQINPQATASIARTADILREEALRAERLDQQNFREISLTSPDQNIENTDFTYSECVSLPKIDAPLRQVFDLHAFLTLSLAEQRGVIRVALDRLQVDRRDVGMADIDAMIWRLRLEAPTGGPYSLTGQFSWSTTGATRSYPPRLSIHRADALPIVPDHPYLTSGSYRTEILAKPKNQPSDTQFEVPSTVPLATVQTPVPCPGVLRIPNGWALSCTSLPVTALPEGWRAPQPWRVFLDATKARHPVLTSPSAGLRFAPFGLRGRHKQLGDYFTDHKVPQALRIGWPLIIERDTQEILWVCGYEIAYSARITDQSTDVVRLDWSLQTQPVSSDPIDSMPSGT